MPEVKPFYVFAANTSGAPIDSCQYVRHNGEKCAEKPLEDGNFCLSHNKLAALAAYADATKRMRTSEEIDDTEPDCIGFACVDPKERLLAKTGLAEPVLKRLRELVDEGIWPQKIVNGELCEMLAFVQNHEMQINTLTDLQRRDLIIEASKHFLSKHKGEIDVTWMKLDPLTDHVLYPFVGLRESQPDDESTSDESAPEK